MIRQPDETTATAKPSVMTNATMVYNEYVEMNRS